MLGTRQEPELGLHRLRLAGRLVEVRASDLRFSQDETRALLEASDIRLSDEAVALLHERTEGWVAGLRLAAISLAGHPDPERFVSGVLRQRAHGRRLSAGGGAGAPAGGGPRPAAADLDPRPGERTAGRLPHGVIGLRADPARPRGGKRLRHLARRGAHRGFATTTCSPTYCASSCAGPIPPASARCTGRPPAGTRSTDIRSRRSGTPRRQRIGAYAARLLADNYLSLLLDGRNSRPSASCWPPFRPTLRRRTRSWRSPLPATLIDRSRPRGGARLHRSRPAAG